MRQRQISFRRDLISLRLSPITDITRSKSGKKRIFNHAILRYAVARRIAFKIRQLSIQEPAILPYISFAGPARMGMGDLHWPIPPPHSAPFGQKLRRIESDAVRCAEARRLHGQSCAASDRSRHPATLMARWDLTASILGKAKPRGKDSRASDAADVQ